MKETKRSRKLQRNKSHNSMRFQYRQEEYISKFKKKNLH